MFDPKPKLILCLALFAIGLVVGLYGLAEEARIGDVPAALVPLFGGATAAIVGLSFAIYFGRAVQGQAELRAGCDVVARWWVSAADWNRFRAFDDAREPFARNKLRFRPRTRSDGIEVIVGARELMVDGSWHLVKGKISSETPCGACWFEVAPCCLEIAWTAESENSTRLELVRLPVPEAARAEGQRVLHHFRALVPEGHREWVERNLVYDFGAHMPKGFEAGSKVEIPAVFANRRRHKRQEAFYLVALFAAGVALLSWLGINDEWLPPQPTGIVAVAALAVAIVAAGAALAFTHQAGPDRTSPNAGQGEAH